MKHSTKIAITVVLIFGVVIGFMSYGKHIFGKFSDPSARMHYMMSHISKKLDLDSKQQQKLAALKEEIETARLKLHDHTGSIHDEVKSMISAEPFNQAKMIEMINNKAAIINEVAPDIVAATGDFLDDLNADQKEEILGFVARKRYRHGFHYK